MTIREYPISIKRMGSDFVVYIYYGLLSVSAYLNIKRYSYRDSGECKIVMLKFLEEMLILNPKMLKFVEEMLIMSPKMLKFTISALFVSNFT